jgi:hypothetical protein
MDRVLIEHNTIVNLQAGSAPIQMVVQNLGGGVLQDASVIIVRNNVLHQPNATVPQTAFAPLSTAPVITPFTINYRRRAEVFTGNTGATIATGQSIVVPYNQGDFWATTPGTSTSYLPEAVNNTDLRIAGFNSGTTVAANTYSLTYEAGGIRIRNDGAPPWPSASFVFAIERAATALPPPITSVATPVSTGALYAPLLGSDALGLAGEADIRDDFFGDIRPQMSSYGALEAAD